MQSPLPIFCGFLLIGLFVMAGCGGRGGPVSNVSQAPLDRAPEPHAAHGEARGQASAEPDDPQRQALDALTRKTTTYAEDLEQIMARRERQVPAPAEQPSQVEWAEPEPASDPAMQATAAPAEPPAPAAPPAGQEPPRAQPPTPAPPAPSAWPSAADPPQAAAQDSFPASSRAGDELEHRLRRQVREYPRDIAGHLEYQLLQFLHGEPVPQMSAITSLPAEDRELLAALLDGLSNFRSAVRSDNNMLLSRKIRPLVQMTDRLRSQADLHIPTMVLCSRVDGFGVYEPIEPPRFMAGREHPVIVYCEVQNFTSQLDDDQRWETKLSQEAVLYTETGMQVWQDQAHTVRDRSRNRRRDFFVVKLVRLPANLTIGQYVLKVTIIDQHGGQVAEASVPVQVVAQ
jgi:hypothetical protein